MKYRAIVIADDYRRECRGVATDIEAAAKELMEKHGSDVGRWSIYEGINELECIGRTERRVEQFTPDGAHVGHEYVDDEFYIWVWEEE